MRELTQLVYLQLYALTEHEVRFSLTHLRTGRWSIIQPSLLVAYLSYLELSEEVSEVEQPHDVFRFSPLSISIEEFLEKLIVQSEIVITLLIEQSLFPPLLCVRQSTTVR